MKIKVSDLLESFSAVESGLPKTTVMPILENYFFASNQSRITTRTTDLTDQLNFEKKDVQQEAEFSVCLPKLFFSIISELPKDLSGELTILENHKMKLEFPNKKYIFSFLDDKEFPEYIDLFKEGETKQFKIDVDDFYDGLDKVTFMLKNTDLLERNCSVFVELDDNLISFTGTESNILSHCEKTIDNTGITGSFLLPKTCLSKIRNSNQNGIFNVSFNNKQALFENGNMKITVKLFSTKYPDYRKVVPNIVSWVYVNRQEFLQATRRIGKLVDNEDDSRRIKLTVRNNKIDIEGFESIELVNVSNSANVTKETVIHLSHVLLQKALSNIDEEVVKISWESISRPIIVSGTKGTNDYIIVQPMREK
jgi:DNA polymerase III sliding clamp (beta) subunit (PCNA family)